MAATLNHSAGRVVSLDVYKRQLNETEEQLSAARRTFNACVTDYNNAVQTFPSNLLAGMFGFTRKSVFSISEQERTVPNVNNLLNQ